MKYCLLILANSDLWVEIESVQKNINNSGLLLQKLVEKIWEFILSYKGELAIS